MRSFSGARADTIGEKLSEYNIDVCKTIILQVGGKNADDGVDLDTFFKSYVSLLNSISGENRRIIVFGLLPHKSVDLKPYNDILKKICDENDIELIDNYDSFLLASGEMPKCLTAKLLQQGYRYHKLRKTFSKFYRRHYELISKYNVGLKTLLSEGLSEPEFYGDLVYI